MCLRENVFISVSVCVYECVCEYECVSIVCVSIVWDCVCEYSVSTVCVCVCMCWHVSVVLHETTLLAEKRIFFFSTNLFILLGNVPCSEMQIESI